MTNKEYRNQMKKMIEELPDEYLKGMYKVIYGFMMLGKGVKDHGETEENS